MLKLKYVSLFCTMSCQVQTLLWYCACCSRGTISLTALILSAVPSATMQWCQRTAQSREATVLQNKDQQPQCLTYTAFHMCHCCIMK